MMLLKFDFIKKCILETDNIKHIHCVKSVQTGSFFWSIFSRIQTEYGEMLRISPYSVQMRENTGQKKLPIWTLFTQSNLRCSHSADLLKF